MNIYPFNHRETRILIDVREETYKSIGGTPQALRDHITNNVVPFAPERFRDALTDTIRDGRLRSVPNRWMPASRNTTPGLIALGDTLNMRHPLSGAGMTVALKDAILLSEMLAPAEVPSLTDHKLISSKMKTFHWTRKRHASVLNIIAQAMYALFRSKGRFPRPRLD